MKFFLISILLSFAAAEFPRTESCAARVFTELVRTSCNPNQMSPFTIKKNGGPITVLIEFPESITPLVDIADEGYSKCFEPPVAVPESSNTYEITIKENAPGNCAVSIKDTDINSTKIYRINFEIK